MSRAPDMPMVGEVGVIELLEPDGSTSQHPIVVSDLLGRGGEGVVVAASAEEDYRSRMDTVSMGIPANADIAIKIGDAVADEVKRRPPEPPKLRHIAAFRGSGTILLGGKRYECAIAPVFRKGSVEHDIAANGPLHADQAADYACCMLSALRQLHDRDMVHADVKPGNLLVVSDHRCVLADFGGAHKIGESTSRCLTIGFASERVLRGFPTEPRDDIHAAGVSLAHMLRGESMLLMSRTIVGGKSKWGGQDDEALNVLADHQPTLLRTGDPAMDVIVARMIAPSAHEQFDCVDAMAALYPFTSSVARERTVDHGPLFSNEDLVAIGDRILARLDPDDNRYEASAAPMFRLAAEHLAHDGRLTDDQREMFEAAAHAPPPLAEQQAALAQRWIRQAQDETKVRVESAVQRRDPARPSMQVDVHRQAPPPPVAPANPKHAWWERR